MSCSRPLIAIPTEDFGDTGKPQYKIISSEGLSHFDEVLKQVPGSRLIPCGKCMECRLAYSRQWADRMMLELVEQKKAIFLTLTYDDNHIHPATFKPVVYQGFLPRCKNEVLQDDGYFVPEFSSLDKRDAQLFIKRLRKHFEPLKLRYYLAGEYGDRTLRPHMHMILYGIGLEDFKICDRGEKCRTCSVSEEKYRVCRKSMIAYPCGKNELGDCYYSSPLLEKIWKNGFVLFSDVSWKTCAYVARYVTKKVGGDLAESYMVRNCIPEFSLQSRNPGIGRAYFDSHPDVLDFSNIHLSTPDGGLKMNIPKYFLRLADESEDLTKWYKCYKLKEKNSQVALDASDIRRSQTTLCESDYLKMKEHSKKDSVKQLMRNKL